MGSLILKIMIFVVGLKQGSQTPCSPQGHLVQPLMLFWNFQKCYLFCSLMFRSAWLTSKQVPLKQM